MILKMNSYKKMTVYLFTPIMLLYATTFSYIRPTQVPAAMLEFISPGLLPAATCLFLRTRAFVASISDLLHAMPRH